MTRISKLEPYFRSMGFDLYEVEKFYRDGLDYTDEDEERALKQFAGNIIRSIAAIVYDITDEDMLAGEDERAEEAIALSFSLYREKRSDRASSDSRTEYAAMGRVEA